MRFVRLIAMWAPPAACRFLLHGLGCCPGAGVADAEVESAKRVIDTVEWLRRIEEERRDILRRATFPQWPVSGAAPCCAAMSRRHAAPP